MKILLLYTYNMGYLSGFFTEMARHLAREGHKVSCFSLKTKATVFEDQEISYLIAKRGGYLKTYCQIYKVIKDQRPDVILSNFSYVNPALLFGRLLGIQKNIVWFHSLNEQTNATQSNIVIKKMFLKLSDLVIANSELTKSQLQEVYKVPESKLVPIPFWTNIQDNKGLPGLPNEISTDANFIRIGCPGRLEKSKNQKLVIEALPRLRNMGFDNVQLYLAGRGNEREYLETRAKELKVFDQVVFLNHLSHDEMVGFYKAMDVVVLPSLHEAFGLVFIEAIALGAPVVVSKKFGALTFIDLDRYRVNDFTFHPESVDSLVEKLLPYLKNDGLSEDFFKRLYQENFDKEIIFNKLQNILTG